MRGLAAVVLCLVLTSCADQAPPQGPASGTQLPVAPPGTSAPAPLPPSSAALTTTPSRVPGQGETTVRGTVSAGAESGCLLLATGTAQYLLLGADPAIAVAGAVVEVSGRAEPGATTTCQQGTPFHVTGTRRG
ncbi:hypothetical protein SAMN05216188_12836 [Lentzea xinjiangensis]|uniref:Uncharacterized protein n=1 Tax=Lentzea xinjiangensis TaxID=402600 RepID=A0A1H9VUQ9_9PSEU|nr:hypothetical protein [Lentzea xinjiangensis]SES25415.1 hypothetical protein SAMN05216188_12836 [Lentzea xinjiangensis]